MRLPHQLAEAHQIAARQGVGGGQGAGILPHHVAGTAVAGLVQPGLARFQRGQIQVTQRLDPVVTGGGLALLAAGVVFAVHQAAAHVGVDDQHRQIRGHGDEAGLQGAAVQQQGVIPLAAGGDHLIHDAAVAADELVLRLLAVEGNLGLADGKPLGFLEGLADGHLQGGGRGKAGALGHVAGDHQVEAAQGVATGLQMLDHAADVVAPALIRVMGDGLVQAEQIPLVAVVGGDHVHQVVAAPADGDAGLVVDGTGQHEAVVVVGVLADEVDAAGGAHQQVGLLLKLLGKHGADALAGGHGVTSLAL